MFTLRRITLLTLTLAVTAALPLVSQAQRLRPPNLKMGHGIDMRDGPLLNASFVDAASISLGGTAPITSWNFLPPSATNGFIKIADVNTAISTALIPYSTTIADAASDLASMTEAAGYTPASAFLYSTAGSEVTITGYVGTAVNVRIPPYIGGFPVVGLGNGTAVSGSAAVKSLILPSTLRNIGANALRFNGFGSGLSSLVIPAAVTNIGNAALQGPSVYFEGPLPSGCVDIFYSGGSLYYLAGYRYPSTIDGVTTALYGPAQAANSLILSGTNLYFISSTGITNLVNVTPLP